MRFALSLCILSTLLSATEYPRPPADPQPTGWPLTPAERDYIVNKPEFDRRPGREINQHLPNLWPVVPTAGFWGGEAWLKVHEGLVKMVQANAGPTDVLLVGDSITIQWADSWQKNFPHYKAVNIGIGGDKTQNVLWRLDHGGVEGLKPKVIILMIGNNNMFFTPETGIEPAAQGVAMCHQNLRDKFPEANIIVTKILPCHAPKMRFYEDILLTNVAIEKLHLEQKPKTKLLDLTSEFLNADGTIKAPLFTPDHIHLTPEGYAVYARKLQPLLQELLPR